MRLQIFVPDREIYGFSVSGELITSVANKENINIGFVLFNSLDQMNKSGVPNGNFRENICSEDDLRTRIFGTFVVKFLACLPLLGFLNIYKMV